ncbi:hypothetical protein GMRT_11700 [Giardia muris]|uniref:Uncharacterized protein n=1 Tax=Giardia muris TaxID=5742 RepID=A0A4Z1SST6_GIAMU|nr:hypothetical protein GMRT_11700 [Giardia muris]|eukprot:TNJ26708.1 hypothetical protein GMRT_11700 [Giardia muris]
MSKGTKPAEAAPSVFLRLQLSFDPLVSTLPRDEPPPQLVLALPGGLRHTLVYWTTSTPSPSSQPSQQPGSASGKARAAKPTAPSEEYTLLTELDEEVPISNPLTLAPLFIGERGSLRLEAPATKGKEDKTPGNNSFSFFSALLVVDLPIRDTFLLTSGDKVMLKGTMHLRIHKAMHPAPDTQVTFLPRSVVAQTGNYLVLRVLALRGLSIPQSIDYREAFFDAVQVQATLCGQSITSTPISQELLGGFRGVENLTGVARSSGMKYISSTEVPVDLCFATSYLKPGDVDQLRVSLSETPLTVTVRFRDVVRPPTLGKQDQAKSTSVAPFQCEAEGVLSLVDLLEEDRVIDRWINLTPSFKTSAGQLLDGTALASEGMARKQKLQTAQSAPETLPIGTWDSAMVHVQIALASQLTSPPETDQTGYFERAYVYLKPDDLLACRTAFTTALQLNLNGIRLLNSTLAAQLLGKGEESPIRAIPPDKLTAKMITDSELLTYTDSPERLQQCATLLKPLTLTSVAANVAGSPIEASTVAPFITGWHMCDSSYQLIYVEAPAGLGLLQALLNPIQRVLDGDTESPSDTLVGPCIKHDPSIRFRRRLCPDWSLALERFCFVQGLQVISEQSSSWTTGSADRNSSRYLEKLLSLTVIARQETSKQASPVGRRSQFTYAPVAYDMRMLAERDIFLTGQEVRSLLLWIGGILPLQLRDANLLASDRTTTSPKKSTSPGTRPSGKPRTASRRSTSTKGISSLGLSDVAKDAATVAPYGGTLGMTAQLVSELIRDNGFRERDAFPSISGHSRLRTGTNPRAVPPGSTSLVSRSLGRDGELEEKVVEAILCETVLPPSAQTLISDAISGRRKFQYSNQTLGKQNILSKAREIIAEDMSHKGFNSTHDEYRNQPLLHLPVSSKRYTAEYDRERRFVKTPNLKSVPFAESGSKWRHDYKTTVEEYRKDDLQDPWDEEQTQRMLLSQPPASNEGIPRNQPAFHTWTQPLEYFETDKRKLLSVIRDDAEYRAEVKRKEREEWKKKIVVSHTHINPPKATGRDCSSSLARPILQDPPQKYSLKLANAKGDLNTPKTLASAEHWQQSDTRPGGGIGTRALVLKNIQEARPDFTAEIIAIARSSKLIFKNREEEDQMTDSEKARRKRALREEATRQLMARMRAATVEELEGLDTNSLMDTAKRIIRLNGAGDDRVELTQFDSISSMPRRHH